MNTPLYRSLFFASQGARFLALAGSETESGQSGLQETSSHKPPHAMGRSLTLCACGRDVWGSSNQKKRYRK